jgi:hypothetical protein
MKITSPFKDFTTIEFYLFGLFLVYLVIPFRTPYFLHKLLANPIGLIFLLCVAVALFFTTPPILAIVFILVIYELLRRDGHDDKTYRAHAHSHVNDNTSQEYNYVSDPVFNESIHSSGDIVNKPTAAEPYVEPKNESIYLPTGGSLEELMVTERAPVDYSRGNINESNFKPINGSSFGASYF